MSEEKAQQDLMIGLLKRRELLEEELGKLPLEIDRACRQYDEDEARRTFEKMLMLNDVRREVDEIVALSREGETTPVYVMDSLFLRDLYSQLTRNSREDICFATGTEFGGVYIPDRIVTFELESSTTFHAEGNFISTHEKLVELDRHGHRLLAHFHSHPGDGEFATTPSPVDRDFQNRLERGGYPCVGGIFSRDGHVGFFSLKREFRIQIFGKGVRNVSKNVYRIEKNCEVRDETGKGSRWFGWCR